MGVSLYYIMESFQLFTRFLLQFWEKSDFIKFSKSLVNYLVYSNQTQLAVVKNLFLSNATYEQELKKNIKLFNFIFLSIKRNASEHKMVHLVQIMS